MNNPEPLRRPPSINHEPIPFVRRVIAIASGKGGVGKSTVTVNLAQSLQANGQRVGILDADIYGPSIPRMLGLDTYIKPEIAGNQMVPPIAHGIRAMSMALITGDQAAVLRAPMITKTLVQFLRTTRWGEANAELDILLIDLPPGTGDITLSLAQNVALDGVLIVTTPQQVAVIDADKCASAFTKLSVPILGIIENMSYFTDAAGNTNQLFGQGGGEQLAQKYQTKLLAQLPLDPTIGTSGDTGQNFIANNPTSFATEKFRHLAKQI